MINNWISWYLKWIKEMERSVEIVFSVDFGTGSNASVTALYTTRRVFPTEMSPIQSCRYSFDM